MLAWRQITVTRVPVASATSAFCPSRMPYLMTPSTIPDACRRPPGNVLRPEATGSEMTCKMQVNFQKLSVSCRMNRWRSVMRWLRKVTLEKSQRIWFVIRIDLMMLIVIMVLRKCPDFVKVAMWLEMQTKHVVVVKALGQLIAARRPEILRNARK